jgi:hypothetical protein
VLWLHAGVNQFDLAGTGNAFLVAARGDWSLSRVFRAEGSVGFTYTRQQLSQNVPYLIPEIQLQAQLPDRVVQPYLGIGGGFFVDLRSKAEKPYASDVFEIMGSLAGSIRWRVHDVFHLRAEFRGRGIGEGGSAATWTLGLGQSL